MSTIKENKVKLNVELFSLNHWSLGNWDESLREHLKTEVEHDAFGDITITFKVEGAVEETVRRIIKEGIETFFNHGTCSVWIQPEGIVINPFNDNSITIPWENTSIYGDLEKVEKQLKKLIQDEKKEQER